MPHRFECSISPHSRDSSVQYNSCFSNGNDNTKNFASNPVSVLPDDLKLLPDLQEFVSAADLPPFQVPSTRELIRRGRQDLANAVRWKGEKVISQLLSNPNFSWSNDPTKQVEPNPVVAVTSKSEACESSKGVFKPEAVPNTRISLQDPANASQITDLVPQNRPNLLISQYEIEKNLHDLSDKDCATVDSTTQVTNSDTSNMGYDGIESKQVLPRTQNAVSFSVVEGARNEGGSDDEDATEVYTYKD